MGVPFPLVAIEILRFATSTAHLQELVYGGKTYAAAEAYGRGLVDEVVPSGELLDQACETAARLSSDPIARFRITKRQLRRPAIERMERLAAQTDAEVLAEPERRIAGDPPAAAHDLADTVRRHPQDAVEFGGAEAERRHEILVEDRAGVDGGGFRVISVSMRWGQHFTL